ncbi:MAG: hypothetical protein AABY06_02980 [Nanoarchaeota archaeon]
MGHYAAEMGYQPFQERIKERDEINKEIFKRINENDFIPKKGMKLKEITDANLFSMETSMIYTLMGKNLPKTIVKRIKKDKEKNTLISFITKEKAKTLKKRSSNIPWNNSFYPFMNEWYDARYFKEIN